MIKKMRSAKPWFDVAMYRYLNPGLQIPDGQDPADFYSKNTNETLYVARLPEGFDANAYILERSAKLDASALGRRIADEARRDDVEVDCDLGSYVSNLNLVMRLVSRNLLEVARSTELHRLSPKSLGVGDSIRLKRCAMTVAYPYVTWVDYAAGQVRVSDPRMDLDDVGALYLVDGIRVPDVTRVAAINYVRELRERCAGQWKLSPDPSFNAELYKTLYPDARHLSCTDAYLDLIARRGRGENRIGKADDLVNTESLVIDHPLDLLGAQIERVKQTFSPPGDPAALVTERAVGDALESLSRFPREVTFESRTEFRRGACVKGIATFADGLGTCAIGIGGGSHHDRSQCYRLLDRFASLVSDHGAAAVSAEMVRHAFPETCVLDALSRVIAELCGPGVQPMRLTNCVKLARDIGSSPS